MSIISERVSLPDPSARRLLHPTDVAQAHPTYVRGCAMSILAAPEILTLVSTSFPRSRMMIFAVGSISAAFIAAKNPAAPPPIITISAFSKFIFLLKLNSSEGDIKACQDNLK